MEPQQPTLEPSTKIKRLHVLRLAALLCICAALRVGLICKTDVIARDGTVYVSISRQWASGPLRVVQEYDYHVGYTAVVSLVGRALRADGWSIDASGRFEADIRMGATGLFRPLQHGLSLARPEWAIPDGMAGSIEDEGSQTRVYANMEQRWAFDVQC